MAAPLLLVTGARCGIGRALAEHYLDAGWSVAGCSRRESDLAHERYVHFELDVSDEAAVKAMVARLRREHRGIDALVNNAGVAAMNHALLTPMSTVQRVLSTNVCGMFLCAREVARAMRGRRGRIVNLVSVAEPLRLAGEAIYAASKAAVESLTRTLAYELAPLGITINAVGPAPLRTDMLRGIDEQQLQALLQRQALQRMAEMRDVINVVEFFLAEASDFVTGQVIYLGGVS